MQLIWAVGVIPLLAFTSSLRIRGQSTIVAAKKACTRRALANGPSGCLEMHSEENNAESTVPVIFDGLYLILPCCYRSVLYSLYNRKGWCASHITEYECSLTFFFAATAEFKRSSVGKTESSLALLISCR